MFARFSRILLLASLFSFFLDHSFAMNKEEGALIEHMRRYYCPSLELQKERVETGFRYMGNLDTLTPSALFQKGIALRKGTVKGLEALTIERLFFQYICFKNVRVFEKDLHRRALHNQAATMDLIGSVIKELADEDEYTNRILPVIYQEAWYLLSLTGYPQSKQIQKRFKKEKLIDFVIGNPKLDEKFGTKSYRKMVEEACAKEEDKIVAELPMINEEIAFTSNMLVTKLLEKTGFEKEDIQKILNSEEAKIISQNAITKEGMFSNLKETKAKILSEPYHLKLEESGEKETTTEEAPYVDLISFDPQAFSDLAKLFNQLVVNIKTTPKLRPDEPEPVTVFIGRSVSWPSILQQYVQHRLPETLKFKHALVSGLRNEPLSEEELKGYKGYLDSLGFGDIQKETPLLITDVAETARSLQRYGEEILKPLYGFTNIQYLAIMFPGQTIDLERARVIYVTNRLSNIMFAKHTTNAIYCPFPPFYPSQWAEWGKYTQDFNPHSEAQKLKNQLKEWVKSSEGQRTMEPVISYAKSD